MSNRTGTDYPIEDAVRVISDPRGFVRICPTGALTDELLVACSRKVRASVEFQTGRPALMDLSEITELTVSTPMLLALAEAARRDTNKLGICATTPAAFGLARMYELTADWTSERIQVFRDKQAAITWLLETPTL